MATPTPPRRFCQRRSAIAEHNKKLLAAMHPKVPKITKQETIEGLLPICDDARWVLKPKGDPQAEPHETVFLCTRCKEQVGGIWLKNGYEARAL
jgi:hypothetical protein